MKRQAEAASRAAQHWRRRLGLVAPSPAAGLESLSLESTEAGTGRTDDTPADRIERAREAMIRMGTDQLGGDPALLEQVRALAFTGKEAMDILATDESAAPHAEQLAALEAIVAFDGTRPSFLVKDDRIDFQSSFNTASWENDLQGFVPGLALAAACVGRVELGTSHIGTAFLVAPTLAITNRHVAQAIARFEQTGIALRPDANLDFGREREGRASFDRRHIEAILFAGKEPIAGALDHRKLDLAVLRVAPSTLGGAAAERSLSIDHTLSGAFDSAGIVATVGYPAAPGNYVPATLKSKYDDVLKKLLEGDGGTKRFAPGMPAVFDGDSGPEKWTVAHDATTINGNSGSPVFMLNASGSARVALSGLHYGGNWGGERVNWAHLLAAVGPGIGYGGSVTFADFCKAEGIAF
jgi:hypothetical protein